MTLSAQRQGRRIATTVADETLREWADLPWPSGDVSVDPLYLRFAARELLELRENVKQLEEEKTAALRVAAGLPADVLDERHRIRSARFKGRCIPSPGPDREPEGPTEEEPEVGELGQTSHDSTVPVNRGALLHLIGVVESATDLVHCIDVEKTLDEIRGRLQRLMGVGRA